MPFPQFHNSEPRTTVSDEIALIPLWSIAAALVCFVFVQYVFWVYMPAHRHHPPLAPGLHAFFSISWGEYAALNALAIGYVSKDAVRRGMGAAFWMLICLVAPGGVGAVMYFLLRQPIISKCPACSTEVHAEYHFCPQCAFQIGNSCGVCYRSARVTDQYCVYCGHDLAKDNTPARLRAFIG